MSKETADREITSACAALLGMQIPQESSGGNFGPASRGESPGKGGISWEPSWGRWYSPRTSRESQTEFSLN